MDLSFNSRMEAYYQKFIDLQEKLRNSEEERLKLEMKFNEMVQVAKDEEQLHYKKLRSQYKRFLDEDKKRQERNERIMRTLERIEARISMLASKTERFRMLKHQYQGYLQRTSRVKSIERREYPPREQFLLDANKDVKGADVNKTLNKSNDEKIEILDKYLQNLSSQKCRDAIENQERHEYSNLKDASKKVEQHFDSNRANSIAEDIMNSIYSRHYYKDLPLEGSSKTSKFIVPNDIRNEKLGEYGDNKNSFSSNGLEHCLPKRDIHFDGGRDRQFRYLNNDISTPYIDTTATEKNTASKKYADNEKSPVTSSGLYITKHGNDSEQHYENAINSKVYNSSDQDVRKFPLDEDEIKLNANFSNSDKLLFDPIEENINASMKRVDHKDIKRSDSEIDLGLGKADTPVAENEKRIQDDKLSITEKDDSAVEFPNKSKEEVIENIETESTFKDDTVSEKHKLLKNVTNENVINEEKDDAVKQHEDTIINDKDDNDTLSHLTKILEITISEELKTTQMELNQQKDDHHNEEPPIPHRDPVDVNKGNVNVGLNEYSYNQDDDANKDNVNNDVNEYNQDIQYDQYGQPVDYRHYDNNIVDAEGESMQPQYEQTQGSYDQGVHYDDSGQIAQEYNENGEVNLYNQQYNDSNKPSQFYDEEHDQSNQQYNQSEQLNNPYGEQYDESGQPLHQYDENGQIVEQYDENGQPTNIYNQPLAYDENGQPLYGENGQPTDMYLQNQQVGEEYQQSFPQYDVNGQEFQQYDENGEIVQNYGYDAHVVPQYDDGGQPLTQLEGSGEIHQDYSETDQQFQPYDENVQPVLQTGESIDTPQHFSEDVEPVQQDENEFKINDDQQDMEKIVEQSNLEQLGNLTNELPIESPNNVIEGDAKADGVGEESVPHPKESNVLELLDTDTESVKQNTSKISNESDFDFSNS